WNRRRPGELTRASAALPTAAHACATGVCYWSMSGTCPGTDRQRGMAWRLHRGSEATRTRRAADGVVVEADARRIARDIGLRERALEGRAVLGAVGVRPTGGAARAVGRRRHVRAAAVGAGLLIVETL